MSERGVFAVDRGVFDHPMFAPEPFTEREAWLWMVGQAAWKETRTRVGRALVRVERGQLAFANRFLAEKWRWSEPRVRRFLKRLTGDAMVLVQATRDATLLTICNYEKYAFGRRADDAQTDAQTDAKATNPRRKEEEPKKERTNNPSLRSGTRLPLDWTPSPEGLAFAATVLAAERIPIEIEKFRDYWHARAGPNAVKRDWEATWRNWCRKAAENGANGNAGTWQSSAQRRPGKGFAELAVEGAKRAAAAFESGG